MAKESLFVRLISKQMGTAVLERRTTGTLIKGIIGRFLQSIAMYTPMPSSLRVWFLKIRGVKVGKRVFIGFEAYFDPTYPELITLEDDVAFSGRCIVLAHANPPSLFRKKNLQKMNIAPVVIKKGAWIAVQTVILPGVTIGEFSIVAAGSVVNKDIPPYTAVGGTPAKIIKHLHQDITIKENTEYQ